MIDDVILFMIDMLLALFVLMLGIVLIIDWYKNKYTFGRDKRTLMVSMIFILQSIGLFLLLIDEDYIYDIIGSTMGHETVLFTFLYLSFIPLTLFYSSVFVGNKRISYFISISFVAFLLLEMYIYTGITDFILIIGMMFIIIVYLPLFLRCHKEICNIGNEDIKIEKMRLLYTRIFGMSSMVSLLSLHISSLTAFVDISSTLVLFALSLYILVIIFAWMGWATPNRIRSKWLGRKVSIIGS